MLHRIRCAVLTTQNTFIFFLETPGRAPSVPDQPKIRHRDPGRRPMKGTFEVLQHPGGRAARQPRDFPSHKLGPYSVKRIAPLPFSNRDRATLCDVR